MVQAAPFLRQGVTTPGLMNDVILASLPVLALSCWYFGLGALLVVLATTAGAALAELMWPGRRARRAVLLDGSAVLTGILLGLTLPPAFPLWMAFLGGVVAIGLGKVIWGGLGNNLFNPALVGRAFLQAAFPSVITTWTAPAAGELIRQHAGTFARPLLSPQVDAVSGATPLAAMKSEAERVIPDTWDLLTGNIGGSLGETSALLIIVIGVILALRRTFDWRIPVAALLAVAVFSGALWGARPGQFATPVYQLLSGGFLFGVVFMATDPVTSPLSPKGAWIFGAGIGFLVVLIRVFGGLPEGVMYAILLMNACTPLIDRWCQPKPFGRGRRAG